MVFYRATNYHQPAPMSCNCHCPKPKITFRLEKWEKAVVFQVLDMDERFRTSGNSKIYSFHPLGVGSGSYPSLNSSSVFLRGYCVEDDFKVAGAQFESNAMRDAYYCDVLSSLKAWANNWEGWKEDAPRCACAPATNEENVFSF